MDLTACFARQEDRKKVMFLYTVRYKVVRSALTVVTSDLIPIDCDTWCLSLSGTSTLMLPVCNKFALFLD